MNLVNDFNTLVIVGRWNKAIFNPEWISKFLLMDEKLEVEIPLYANGSTRISTKDLRIYVLNNKLNFSVLDNSDETFRKIEELALKVADYLPHTPVDAFGINYKFEDTENSKIDDCFSYDDSSIFEKFGFTRDSTLIKRSFKKDSFLFNLSVTKKEDKSVFDFNYHYVIKSLVEFKKFLDTDILINLKEQSKELLSEIYSLEIKQNGK